ncbi:MAG: DUF4381 domain-containing protein [Halioglobus sp.]|nr:DUF4381 domain-containing protein [Halioglobus sp.]
MNPQDPLADLNPLRQPELIGWWPLAPGWWLLLVAAILCLASLIFVLTRRYRRNTYRRRALIQLQRLHTDYVTKSEYKQYLSELNTLLKSVALVAYPRADIAALHGEAWLTFLNTSLPLENHFQSVFNDAVYQKTYPELDVEQLHRSAQHWIKRHKAVK